MDVSEKTHDGILNGRTAKGKTVKPQQLILTANKREIT
jgi:hypothetical protein